MNHDIERKGESEPCLMTLDEVSKLTGFSGRHIRRLIQKDEFPKPEKWGAASRFLKLDVIEHIQRRYLRHAAPVNAG